MSEAVDPQEEPQGPVIEVEVERLPEGADPRRTPRGAAGGEAAEKARELGAAVGPVAAGLLIDLLDAATINPLLGFLLGWPLGYYILRQVGCGPARASQLGVLIGLYCALPGTFLLPFATLVGLVVQVRRILRRS